MELDLSLKNATLYNGCQIKEVGGRLVLETEPNHATNIIGKNIISMIENADKNSITLTGPMAVWAYLIVFHIVVHRFKFVYYDDGRENVVLLAQH